MNVPFSIRDDLNSDSNVTEQSDRHSEKHLKPENLSLSISRNFDSISNAIDLMWVCSETHFEGIIRKYPRPLSLHQSTNPINGSIDDQVSENIRSTDTHIHP
jgi:hypothetical protein